MEAMKDIIGKIMVEVLGIFAIVTKGMKQGRASKSIPDGMLPVADRGPEKYIKRLIGRRDVEDALERLDRLTQEEAWIATAQVLKVAYRVEGEVMNVGEQVKGVDDKVDVVIQGTSSTFLPTSAIETHIRLDGRETRALVQQTANDMDEAKRSWFSGHAALDC